MIQTFLEDNKFYSIQPTVFLKNLTLEKWSEDAHVRIDFETKELKRCDMHGTLRLEKDADDLWRTPDPRAAGRAIWVYSDKTYRSPQKLSWWTKNADVSYADLKSVCRELSSQVAEWEYQIGQAGCEICEPPAEAFAIHLIGVVRD